MATVVVCDIEDCDKLATMSLTVLENEGPAGEWSGMTADVCGKHDCLGPLMSQWDREFR